MSIKQMQDIAEIHLFGPSGRTIEEAVACVYLTERTDPRDWHRHKATEDRAVQEAASRAKANSS